MPDTHSAEVPNGYHVHAHNNKLRTATSYLPLLLCILSLIMVPTALSRCLGDQAVSVVRPALSQQVYGCPFHRSSDKELQADSVQDRNTTIQPYINVVFDVACVPGANLTAAAFLNHLKDLSSHRALMTSKDTRTNSPAQSSTTRASQQPPTLVTGTADHQYQPNQTTRNIWHSRLQDKHTNTVQLPSLKKAQENSVAQEQSRVELTTPTSRWSLLDLSHQATQRKVQQFCTRARQYSPHLATSQTQTNMPVAPLQRCAHNIDLANACLTQHKQ